MFTGCVNNILAEVAFYISSHSLLFLTYLASSFYEDLQIHYTLCIKVPCQLDVQQILFSNIVSSNTLSGIFDKAKILILMSFNLLDFPLILVVLYPT